MDPEVTRLIEMMPDRLDWLDPPLGYRNNSIVTWSGDSIVFCEEDQAERYLNMIWSLIYLTAKRKDL